MESYKLAAGDRVIASAGRQNVSFSYEESNIRQRIDRVHEFDGKQL